MKAYIFPGQGAQFSGMGLDLYENSDEAQALFEKANNILGFNITDIMFEGTAEQLKETKVTQPAIFLHSVILAKTLGESFKPEMVAGHSLGEFSALVANGALSFEDGLKLVSQRAIAMQKACEALKEEGARRALVLPVGGAFHSPMMEPAREELAAAIENTTFSTPSCPIYQNVTASAVTDPEEIKKNLISQLTAPVKWTQTIQQMVADGGASFTEVGPGKVLQGLMRKIDRTVDANGASLNIEA